MGHQHHDHHEKGNRSNIGTAFFLNLIFTIIEAFGGLYTNSLAILSDAIHDLGDSLALGLAWYFQKKSVQPEDIKYTYGYKRFSVLGAIINSVILIIGSFFIIKAAIPRIVQPQETNAEGMIVLAILGITFNWIAYRKTHHGMSHNERVVSLHLLEDVLGWAAVLIGAVVIYFTGWYAIDPLLSLGISIYILINVIRNVRGTLTIILQGTPEYINVNSIKSSIAEMDLVSDVHDVHIWTMDGNHNVLTAHIVVPMDIDISTANALKARIHSAMREADIHHCTLEFERIGEPCALDQSSVLK